MNDISEFLKIYFNEIVFALCILLLVNSLCKPTYKKSKANTLPLCSYKKSRVDFIANRLPKKYPSKFGYSRRIPQY